MTEFLAAAVAAPAGIRIESAGLFSIILGVCALLGTVFTAVWSGRIQKRQHQTQQSLAELEWAKEFEKRTQAAEAKATKADERAMDAERRQIGLERSLASAELKTEAMIELVDWVGSIIAEAHKPEATLDGLVRTINGGPPAYQRTRNRP